MLRRKLFGHRWGRWDWWPFIRTGGVMGRARWRLRCRHIQTKDI